jgi:hypothetical protein
VRVLEARFHPDGQRGAFVIVGRVICDDACGIVKPCAGAAAGVRASVLTNLRYITAMSRPRPFEILRALRNRFWSFVEVAPDTDLGARSDSH